MHSNSILYKLKINLYGENSIVKKIDLKKEDLDLFNSIARKIHQPLHQALVDPFFYHVLNISNIQCLEDLTSIHWEGLINNQKNQIEIWFRNKKIQKLNINSLQEELLLFPLFNTSRTPVLDIFESGIYTEQREIGLIGSYEISIADFNIDDLVFETTDFKNIIHLCGLKYDGNVFVKKGKDSLVTFQNGFEII